MLHKITEVLIADFVGESEWFSQFFEQKNGQEIFYEQKLKLKLSESLSQIANFFCYSVLSGEYVKDDIAFHELITEIKKISSDQYEATLFKENTQLSTASLNYLKIIEETCNSYEEFHKLIEIRIKNSGIDIVFISPKEKETDFLQTYNYFDSDLVNTYNNFSLLLYLNHLDHLFDESINYFKVLLQLENKFNSIKSALPYVGAIIEKISFLKYKWHIRQITTFKSLKSKAVQRSYIDGSEVLSINETPQFQSANGKLCCWKEHLDNHYGYLEHSDYYLKNFKRIISVEKPCFFEIHFLIKYFKDERPSYINLKEIIECLEDRRKEFVNNDELFNKNYNYALNNLFSLLVDKTDVDEVEVLTLKEKIDSLQNTTSNDNFFVDSKFLKYNLNKINRLVDDREPLEINNVQILKLIDTIKTLIISCEAKIEWSQNHHNLLYQLPYDESVVEYMENEKINVYYASSFLLPLSVEQSHKEFHDLKTEFQNNYYNYNILSTLKKEFQVIKELQEKAKSNDKKSIETLSIFTAVISFIVGTVSGFSFIDSFVQALIFMLLFSASLVTFVLLIFTSTKGIESIKKNWIILSCFYLGFVAVLLFLFVYKNEVDDKVELEKLRIEKGIMNKPNTKTPAIGK